MSSPSLSFPVSAQKQAALFLRMKELQIYEQDLEESFIRGSGPGGQKINKTSMCVQLKHLPTGLEIRCQETRSQAMNRFIARRALCEQIAALIKNEKTKAQQEKEKIRRQKRKRSKRAKEKMLSDKKIRGERKVTRRKPE